MNNYNNIGISVLTKVNDFEIETNFTQSGQISDESLDFQVSVEYSTKVNSQESITQLTIEVPEIKTYFGIRTLIAKFTKSGDPQNTTATYSMMSHTENEVKELFQEKIQPALDILPQYMRLDKECEKLE